MKTWSWLNVFALVCIAASAYLMVHNKDWGWFFFAGIASAVLGFLTDKPQSLS